MVDHPFLTLCIIATALGLGLAVHYASVQWPRNSHRHFGGV